MGTEAAISGSEYVWTLQNLLAGFEKFGQRVKLLAGLPWNTNAYLTFATGAGWYLMTIAIVIYGLEAKDLYEKRINNTEIGCEQKLSFQWGELRFMSRVVVKTILVQNHVMMPSIILEKRVKTMKGRKRVTSLPRQLR